MLSSTAKVLFLSSTLAALTLPGLAQAAPATPVSAAAPAAANAAARTQLQARYTELKAAMESRSAPRIKALLAPGFTSTQLSGKTIDADAMVSELAQVPRDPNRHTTTTLGKVTIEGKTAHVEQTMTASATVKAKDGKSHAMELIAVSQDTWINTPKGWLMASTTSEDMTVKGDGKILRHAHIGDPAVRQAANPNGTMGPKMEGR
ncbi:nuclear transport factor 2 family protein [Novosphingobium sp. 1949]|uniref:Nuclear transport factor 2 family protein n=1 Tax=Novosphingobium organovorum TaxID=2930092 RepID=A0ABT0BEK9_9SPHN|nr:nuclear transport factor 2 family protein [Novosphingobium organovorum]MCJ2183226.1 nuclear transport factor 2 family protein [Novosphingobium organovorum]